MFCERACHGVRGIVSPLVHLFNAENFSDMLDRLADIDAGDGLRQPGHGGA